MVLDFACYPKISVESKILSSENLLIQSVMVFRRMIFQDYAGPYFLMEMIMAEGN